MSTLTKQSGYAAINGAQIYYETAGEGTGLVMLHAGVADVRQWNNEFAYFADRYRVLRYDRRAFGNTEPVDGEFNDMADLTALLDHLGFDQPLILVGCSMGGMLAMDFTLAYPSRVKALIMVASAPNGLDLDVEIEPIFTKVEEAYKAGDLDLVADLETQIWFDGFGRTPDQVDPVMRQLAHDMNRKALDHQAKKLGKRLPNIDSSAAERLSELALPVLVVAGVHDEQYTRVAADYMGEHIPGAQKVVVQDAAHLVNMNQPDEFRRIVETFLDGLGG